MRMAQLLINCPTNGKAVTTGINAQKSIFENPTNNFGGDVKCPCGETHPWTKADAYLAP
jgi:endogenous inhibitor of DNA gyrase (YacG/DUF329 family)